MISIILTALSLIPGLAGVVQTVSKLWFDAKVQMTIAKLNVDRDVAVAMIQSEALVTEGRAKLWGVIGASKGLMAIVIVMAIPVAWYEWKIVIYDTILGMGKTPIITGDVAVWMNSIIYSLFGSATVLAGVQHWWTTKP